MTEREGRIRKQLLNDLKEITILEIEVEALDRTAWRTCFGTRYGLTIRQTTE